MNTKISRGASVNSFSKLNHTEAETTNVDPYTDKTPQKNIIFWGTIPDPFTSLLQKIRTLVWFYPDFLSILIHRLRPLSYIALYSLVLFAGWKTVTYAQDNPSSAINNPPPQILQEGVVGSISSINPLFVTHNQIERDLKMLIFNRLINIGPDGNPKPELATTWAISEDGKQYTFFLREDVVWHDGEAFTADDVIFTFKTVQSLKDDDSYASEFEGLEFEKIDDFTVVLLLPETNPTLTDSLAFPMIPEHLLSDISSANLRIAAFNKYPVGTGPFKVIDYTREHILLERNSDYFKGEPLLETIEYIFFANEEEAVEQLKRFEIHTLTQATGETIDIMKPYKAYLEYNFTTTLRQKIVYFNLRNTGPLASVLTRQALSSATNKETLSTITPIGGTPSEGPIPVKSWAYNDSFDRFGYDIERARELLEQDGWQIPSDTEVDTDAETEADLDAKTNQDNTIRVKNGEPISITLTYLDTPSNEVIAEKLEAQWGKAGVQLELDPQTYDRISTETVPRRNFDALLFEIEFTPDPDKYNLWHSTKIDYPGLNLPGYSYERVDILLEQARTETDKEVRKEDYRLFQKYIVNDVPALYLYHPNYAFIAHDSVRGIELTDTLLPQHRYANVEEWYIER